MFLGIQRGFSLSAAFLPSEDGHKFAEAEDAVPANDLESFEVSAPAAFELYVDDDRYSVPTLHLITAWDAEAATAVAEARLAESGHHRGVELWQSGRRLLVLGAPRRNGV